jgi:uncharacterized membrane protein YqjE
MSNGAQPLLARGRSLLGELLRIVQTRLEMLAIELEQEKIRISRQVRLAIVAALCAWLAGFTLVLWVALSLRPDVRFIVLGSLFGAFTLGALACWIALKRVMRRDALFARLLIQLHLDRESLGSVERESVSPQP